jgi:hypothetical protein
MMDVDVNTDVHSQLDHILTGQQVIGRGELSKRGEGEGREVMAMD